MVHLPDWVYPLFIKGHGSTLPRTGTHCNYTILQDRSGSKLRGEGSVSFRSLWSVDASKGALRTERRGFHQMSISPPVHLQGAFTTFLCLTTHAPSSQAIERRLIAFVSSRCLQRSLERPKRSTSSTSPLGAVPSPPGHL